MKRRDAIKAAIAATGAAAVASTPAAGASLPDKIEIEIEPPQMGMNPIEFATRDALKDSGIPEAMIEVRVRLNKERYEFFRRIAHSVHQDYDTRKDAHQQLSEMFLSLESRTYTRILANRSRGVRV